MAQYFSNFRNLRKGFIAEVYEGEGIPESPGRLVRYVFDEQGNSMGAIDVDGTIKHPYQQLKTPPTTHDLL